MIYKVLLATIIVAIIRIIITITIIINIIVFVTTEGSVLTVEKKLIKRIKSMSNEIFL